MSCYGSEIYGSDTTKNSYMYENVTVETSFFVKIKYKWTIKVSSLNPITSFMLFTSIELKTCYDYNYINAM